VIATVEAAYTLNSFRRGVNMIIAFDSMNEATPMIHLKDIHSLSDFQRNARAHIEHLKKTGRPEVLTVHGQAELVVQHAEAYQKLLDVAANAAAIIGIQRGLQGIDAGTGEDVEDAFASLQRELGIAEQP
jgi:hypothetical protein